MYTQQKHNIKQKSFALFLIVTLICGIMFFPPANAAEPFSGTGTKDDPYVISTSAAFKLFTDRVIGGETYKGRYFKQTTNIDMSSVSGYRGMDTTPFAGVYNGSGHTINVKINVTSGSAAVFPYLEGTILNLGVTGSITTPKDTTNAYACGIARSVRETGSIINCYATAAVWGTEVSGIAQSNRGKIINCYFAGAMTASYRYHVISDPQPAYPYVFMNTYGLSGIDDSSPVNTYTKKTLAQMKTTEFAKQMNAGRAYAKKSGIAESDLLYWNSQGNYPVFTTVSQAVTDTADVTLTYDFTGADKAKAGYAQGNITIIPNNAQSAGTYYLFWADDEKILDGYREITQIILKTGTAVYSIKEQIAIPAGATNLLAVKSSVRPYGVTVDSAAGAYKIPEEKQFPSQKNEKAYSFASYSDIHITMDGSSSAYPYDKQHWAFALDTAAKREVDFIITSGDQVNNANGSVKEWRTYQKILADSPYANPIYEAIGNHELWQNEAKGLTDFNTATGLDSTKATLVKGKSYYEITEPNTGDHFLFMALEGGFYPNNVEEFTDEQLDWLEGLLQQYSGDGKNIYIIEHSLFQGYGSGDSKDTPYYNIPLSDTQASTRRLKSLLEEYKQAVFFSGHTHIAFSEGYNYDDENGTSARMVHNSSVGATRKIVNNKLDYTSIYGETEGYMVDVYSNNIIFNGTNLFYNEILPLSTYIIDSRLEEEVVPTETTEESQPDTTVPVITESTQPADTTAPTVTTDTQETVQDTTATSTVPGTTEPAESSETAGTTEPPETAEETSDTAESTIASSSTADTEPELLPQYGDVDLDGVVSIKDVTLVQQYAADLKPLTAQQLRNGELDNDGSVNVKDATLIQKYLASLITQFPIEEEGRNKGVLSRSGSGFTELSEAQSDLALYYRYSSYDQYQALKKYAAVYAEIPVPDESQRQTLTQLHNQLLDIADPDNIDNNDAVVTVYYSDNKGWSIVYAYAWGSGNGYNKAWPGVQMKYLGKDKYYNKIYAVDIDTEMHDEIIFTDGIQQTANIAFTGEQNVGYYASGTDSSGKITCTSYAFDLSHIVYS